MGVGVRARKLIRFLLREIMALVRLEVVFDPEALALGIDPLVGVRAVAVHVPIRLRNAAIPISQVTWCAVSGRSVQKSHCMLWSRNPEPGSRFCDRMKSGNLMASRMKNTGVLLPTRS